MPFYAIPQGILLDISIIIIVATLFAYLARFTRQPLIPFYMIAGLILGPVGFGFIKDPEVIKNLSEIGIAFLLFIVGLEIDLKKLRTVGIIATLGGLIQVVLTFVFGFIASLMLHFSYFESAVAGLVLAFSSTMVVVKLFSDKEELGTLHGKIIVGILLMQDLLVILALTILQTISTPSVTAYFSVLLKGIILFAFAFVMNKFFVTPVFRSAAKSKEILFLSSISMCFLFSLLASFLGFSIAIGAFIGGVILANLPFHYDIIAKIRPLRDFFSTIFFVSLGLQVAAFSLGRASLPLIVLLGINLVVKPAILFMIVNYFGYGKRASFITAISLAQISEFSLILVILLQDSISSELFSITFMIGVISIAMTSYLVKYDELLYNKASRYLAPFEMVPSKFKDFGYPKKEKSELLLFGCHRMGSVILKTLRKHRHKVFVIDYNPEVILKLMKEKISCMYGDIANMEILQQINFNDAKIAVSTIPNEEDNILLVNYAKKANPKIKTLVTANHLHEALSLYEKGADYVILPPLVSGERVSHFLERVVHKKSEFLKLKKSHLKHLLMLNAEK